jgi:predicted porin
MKKTLIALAALAASTAALAQSSVNLYGVVDLSLEIVKGDDSVTRVTSSNHTTSRFGLKGVEDIGGGLKGKFVLESAISADTGANGGGSTRFFDRAAWLGLQGGFGELRLGRQDTPIGAIVGNTALIGGQAYDDTNIAGTFSAKTYRRTDNAITYVLPTLVEGLSASLQYSTAVGTSSTVGTETAGSDAGKQYGLGLQYAANGFGAGLGYINAKTNAAGSTKDKGILGYLSYDFGAAKLTGYYEKDSSSNTAEDTKLMGLRVDVPVTEAFAAQASLSKAKNVSKTTANDDDNATIFALKGTYGLSKRTSVYGLFTNVSNDKASNLSVGGVTTSADKSSRGLAVGVVHKF